MSETTASGGGPGSPAAGGTGTSAVGRLRSVLLRYREASILVVAVALAIYFQLSNPAFLSSQNTLTVAQSVVSTGVIAAALCLLLICGEIDLSAGQSFAFAPIWMYLASDAGLPVFLAVVVGLLSVALVGLINGLITVYLGVPSLIATLGMFFLLAGLNVTLVDGFPRSVPDGGFVTEALGGSPWSGILWCLAVVAGLQVLLSRTRWGLHTYATGGNPLGSREAGVKVARIKIGNFMLCAVLAGLVGIIEAVRINSIDPLAGGPNIVLLSIAAAVIGGTALLGGVGTATGAFLGALVLSLLQNGFTLQGVDAFTFNIILGIAILVAMTLNEYVGRLRKAGGV